MVVSEICPQSYKGLSTVDVSVLLPELGRLQETRVQTIKADNKKTVIFLIFSPYDNYSLSESLSQ